MARLCSLPVDLLLLALAVLPCALAQTALVVGNNFVVGAAGSFVNCSLAVPSTYSASWDLILVARPALLATTNPANAEVDLYVSAPGLSYSWSSAATGPDAVALNAQIPAAGRFATAEALALGGPLPVTAAGTLTLNVGVYIRTGSSPVNASITVTSAARIQYDWTQAFNTYTGSLLLDQVQIFEYPIPFPQGCSNGNANCTEGHITFLMTPSPVDSTRRGALLGTYPSISGNPTIVPYHSSTYDRSSDVSTPAFAGEMITSNDQLCLGQVDNGRCIWRMMAWAKYAPMPAYTFRAAVIDITTVVDSKSGDHTPLSINAGATAPRAIAAAEMQYYVFYATVPSQALQITVQSLNPGVSGTNVDMWVQNIISSSLPHPDDNGYSWQSALDTVQGTDSVILTTPATYNTPYNVTYWIACFGQRAGTYTIAVNTLVSASSNAASVITPVVDGTNVYTAITTGYWQYFSYAVPSSYSDGVHDIAIIARPALLSTTNPANAEVDLYVTTSSSTSNLQWSSADNGPDAVVINPQIPSTGRTSASASDALYMTGPLPVSAAGSTTLYIGVYVRNGTVGQTVNCSLTITHAARIQYDWTQAFNTYTGSLLLDQVQIFEYPIPFPQGCSNGNANCTEGHITFLMTPSPVDSTRRGALLGTYPSISGNPTIVPYHSSTYDRSSDVSTPAFAGEMITSNDQLCLGQVDNGRCIWRMMAWAKYAPMPAYTFRAAVIDITTVVDSKSGDHTPLSINAGATAPRAIAAAEMQYYVFYATVPSQALQITVQSLNPGVSGTNVDMWVQNIISSSLPHPDDNGYSWQSALDTVQGTDSVILTTPATYNTPYNVTYWIACFGQRAGTYTIAVNTLVSASSNAASVITPVVDGTNVYTAITTGYWQYFSYAVPSSYSDGVHDIAIIARPALLSTTNPANAEVDLYVTTSSSTSNLQWSSADNGPDAVVINPQIPSTGRTSASASDALYMTGPLPVSAAGSTTLYIGVYVRNGTVGQTVNCSLTITHAARIQYDWTQAFNTYTGSLLLDQVQIFEYPIPFPQGCSNGNANCTEGHITFLMTPSPVDSTRRGALLGTYPSISGNPTIVPYHSSTYDRSSDVSTPAFAGEMITSNDQLCLGQVDNGRCIWRMMAWAKYAPMPAYTFRAAVIDITTVVDSKSGDHTPLSINAGATAPRAIAAAEMQYYVFYATVPSQALQITVQSLNPGVSGTNVDMWVQNIISSSLPHPDDNGYSWQSALDTVQGTDSVILTTPATYNTPYNVTYWIACFGQRAGTYTIAVNTLVSASSNAASVITPVVDGTNVYTAITTGYWQYFSYAVPSSYSDGVHDIAIIARPALLSTTNPANAEVDLYVTTSSSTSNLQWSSADNGPDAVVINPQIPSTGRTSASASDALYMTGPLPVSAAGSTTLYIGVYVRNGTVGQTVNCSLTITHAARIQYDWTQAFNTYTGSLLLDQVQIFEYPIPFPQGCSNGNANCTEGHITFLMTPSPVDSTRRGALLGTYPSISGNPTIVPYHSSTYDRSSDVSTPAFAGEMITSNDQLCLGQVDNGRCIWRMMAWAKYAPMPAYTFRAAVIDITTVVDSKSGDHTPLSINAGATAPRAIAAAEMQYYVFYITQPVLNFSLICQSINPGPSGTNVDIFVQSILYSSLPHPDDNGYSWASAADLPSGVDFVNITAPASYNTPFNVTYWVGAFGQRAGTYTLSLQTTTGSVVVPPTPSTGSTRPSGPSSSSTGNAAPPPSSSSSSSSGLSGGAIAGIVIGSVVGAALLCSLCLFFLCLRPGARGSSYGKTEASKVRRDVPVENSQVELSHANTSAM